LTEKNRCADGINKKCKKSLFNAHENIRKEEQEKLYNYSKLNFYKN
jgi:hypothetical protein